VMTVDILIVVVQVVLIIIDGLWMIIDDVGSDRILGARMVSQGVVSRTRSFFQSRSREMNNPNPVLLLMKVLLLSQSSIGI
jgi:hypothetical protein